MSISFNLISNDIETPGQFLEFDNSRAVKGLAGKPMKALMIGQKLAAGTVAAGLPTRIPSGDAAGAYFGRGSFLHAMCETFKLANKNTELYAVALDDIGGGAAAAGTLTVTGTATAAGTIKLMVGGKRVQVAVASGDAQNAIATALNAAINAADALPLTSAVATNVVTATCRHKGTQGNAIDMRLNYDVGDALPAGVSIAIVALAGGATDPDVASALTAIAATQYDTIGCGLSDATNVGKIETELATRWGPDDQIEGQAFFGIIGTVGAMQTLGDARNSPFSTLVGAGKSPTPPWVWAANVAAIDAAEPDPARPRTGLPLIAVLPPKESERPIRSERNALLKDGVTTFKVDDAGAVTVERVVTTYQKNSFNLPDISYRDITTPRTLAYLRYSARARIAQKYPRHKLANDGTNFDPGQAIVTPSVIKSELIDLADAWVRAGLMEGIDQFIEDLIVERDTTNPNRLNFRAAPDLVNQFLVLAGQFQFLL